MRIRLEVETDESGWRELGTYPDRCEAEIAEARHWNAIKDNLRGASYRLIEVDGSDE